jgi:hypothetical protein
MFAIVGFGMNALEPKELTMLITICIGLGITGSSNALNLSPLAGIAVREFNIDGEEGKLPALHPQMARAQDVTRTGSGSFVRMRITWSKVNARRKS